VSRTSQGLATRALGGAAIALAVVACGTAAGPFSPDGPCLTDGRAPGAYPELEAKLPPSLGGIGPANGNGSATEDQYPTTIDSGRNCTEKVLGSLWSHDVRDLRFAGATWDWGDGNGTVSALFTTPSGQPPLEAAWMDEFYESGAKATSKTENIVITRPTIDPAGEVFRLDTLNDLSLQTVVVWPADDGVRVVIVATRVTPDASRQAHDTWVAIAVAQSVTRTQP
jgi:hypothetical protein